MLEALQRAVQSKRVCFITGAGISVKSGIPLYRSDRHATQQSANQQLQERLGAIPHVFEDHNALHRAEAPPSDSERAFSKPRGRPPLRRYFHQAPPRQRMGTDSGSGSEDDDIQVLISDEERELPPKSKVPAGQLSTAVGSTVPWTAEPGSGAGIHSGSTEPQTHNKRTTVDQVGALAGGIAHPTVPPFSMDGRPAVIYPSVPRPAVIWPSFSLASDPDATSPKRAAQEMEMKTAATEEQQPPARGTPGQGTAGQGTPGQGAAGQGTPGQGTAGQGTAGQGTSKQGTSKQGTSKQGTSKQGTPGQGGHGQEGLRQGRTSGAALTVFSVSSSSDASSSSEGPEATSHSPLLASVQASIQVPAQAPVPSTAPPLPVMTPEEENHIRERERTAIWDAKLELLATRDAVIVDPRNWFSHFWFDTHHVEAFLRADPNESHYVIAALCNDPNLRVTCITQNVDNLHRKAGIDPDKLVEIHGRIGYYRCLGEDCTYKSYKYLEAQDLEFFSDQEEEAYYYQVEQLLERDYSLKKIKNICQRLYAMDKHVVGIKKLPCCPECRTPVIPLTLLFDESYTTHEEFGFEKALKWIDESEVLVFCGTSFSVYFTEHATELARQQKKEVFNINIRKDAQQFYGFVDAEQSDELDEDVDEVHGGRRLLINFESDSPDSPVTLAGRVLSSGPQRDDDEDDSPLFSDHDASVEDEGLEAEHEAPNANTDVGLRDAGIRNAGLRSVREGGLQPETFQPPLRDGDMVIQTRVFPGPTSATGRRQHALIHHVVGTADEILMKLLTPMKKQLVLDALRTLSKQVEQRTWGIPHAPTSFFNVT